MVNRPKAIGTAAESAVVRYLKANGFRRVERRALEGVNDRGDITGIPGVVIEVKGGEAAKSAGPRLVEAWHEETETERNNARADIGILVMQRRGFGLANAGGWWAEIEAAELTTKFPGYVRITLTQAVTFLRNSGYGDPL